MWWTLTGNFGNILPIDWSKSYTKQMHVPNLKLGERPADTPEDELINSLSSEDEAVANDLDLHQLILGGMSHNDNGHIQTAEEVIKEIDDIMDEQNTPSEGETPESEVMEKAKEVLGAPLYEDSEFGGVEICMWKYFSKIKSLNSLSQNRIEKHDDNSA